MSIISPFRGLRPKKKFAEKVASPPYDVLNSQEAKEMAIGNPLSFLHINKPEIDLDPSTHLYDPKVYQKGAENLKKLMNEGIFFQDEKPCFYIYRQIMGTHQQTGLVACASIDEYEQDRIKKHELTRPDKEDDRVNHMRALNAQVGPVFLTYKAQDDIDSIINSITGNQPEYDFISADKVQHTFWIVTNQGISQKIKDLFSKVDYLYVADGHHRSAAAQRIRDIKRKENQLHNGSEEYNYFLTVIFPHNQMQILDYNRVVKDLNELERETFLQEIENNFICSRAVTTEPIKPTQMKEFGMYLDNEWYRLVAKKGTYDKNDPVKSLDVNILQENLLTPVLGIDDPRKDSRIDFVGGIRGLKELEKRVNSGEWRIAFALYPTSIEELMAIADAGKIMPPKSTWFEPKLRSGLIIHLLD